MRQRLYFPKGRQLGMNLTPMIDIVFLLLIFFVLLAQSSSRLRAGIQLPEPKPSAAKYVYNSSALTITVICDPQGQLLAYQTEGQMIKPAQFKVLEQKLRQRRLADPFTEVNLRADRRADGQVIELLMAACARAGISKVNLVAAID